MIEIYTDGACNPNPGIGGWASIIIIDGNNAKILSGGEYETTNNRMEIMAVLKSMEWLLDNHSNYPAVIYADSEYVVNAITKWIASWKKKNWLNKKNTDLFKKIDAIKPLLPNLQFKWVKGHAKNEYNNLADSYAVEERKKQASMRMARR